MKDLLTPNENKILAQELNGNVYVHLWMSNFMGDTYWLNKTYYLVEDGVVYEFHNNKTRPSGDALFDIKSDCTLIGKFNPDEKYESGFKEVTFKKLMKFFS